MKKPEQFTNLYRIFVTVDCDTGVKISLHKYRTKFTGQNYLSTQFTKEDDAAGYNIGWGSARVGKDELMKVRRRMLYDKPASVGRSIWFLEGQQDQAIEAVRFELEQTIRTMMEQAAKLYKQWQDRPSNPERKQR